MKTMIILLFFLGSVIAMATATSTGEYVFGAELGLGLHNNKNGKPNASGQHQQRNAEDFDSGRIQQIAKEAEEGFHFLYVTFRVCVCGVYYFIISWRVFVFLFLFGVKSANAKNNSN